MDMVDGLEALGSLIKKGALLTGRIVSASSELLVSLFDYFWRRWEDKRLHHPKPPLWPLGKQK